MLSKLSQLIVVLIGFTLLQCSESKRVTQPDPTPEPLRTPAQLTEQERSLLEATNNFGLSLFKEIAKRTPETENIFISPLSVSYALGLCYNGANGETREAIGSTLQAAGLSQQDINTAFHELARILTQAYPMVEFKTANSFWSRQGKAIVPDFIDLARKYYDARVEEVDFQQPWVADTINAWIEDATNGKIKDMVKPPISPSVAAMLFNAIYFKGSWMYPFDTADTRPATFYKADGSETECDMMHLSQKDCQIQLPGATYPQTDTNIIFYEDDEVFVLGMPYGNGDFRMSIVVPNRWTGESEDTTRTIDDVIAGLTPEAWNSWIAGNTPHRFDLALPRLKFGYDVTMNEMLKSLGMEIAFDPYRADFSNLFSDGVGCIDQVKHKSFIQVDEKGTEAAAVTQVTFVDSMPPMMICDRPFLFVIHEDVSGAILFMGKIADPVWED